MGEHTNTITKHIETLLDISEEVGLELNAEKAKYMFMSHHSVTTMQDKIII
jgi:hypothetical protein